MESGEYLIITCEEPYAPANDPVVLGFTLPAPRRPATGVNRYLLAGIELFGQSVDEALWRVRQDALQRIFRDLSDRYAIYGYQCEGNVRRLPDHWQAKLLHVEERSMPMALGSKKGVRALDRYVMPITPEDFDSFLLSYGEESWFRFYLIKPKAAPFTNEEFDRLNAVYAPAVDGQETSAEGAPVFTRLQVGSSAEQRLAPSLMDQFLDSCEAMLWYAYSPRGRDIDGPHIGICTRTSWKGRLKRLFRPGTSRCRILMELSPDTPKTGYCLDIIREPRG